MVFIMLGCTVCLVTPQPGRMDTMVIVTVAACSAWTVGANLAGQCFPISVLVARPQGARSDPTTGGKCNQKLDTNGRHASCCSKGLYMRLHDRIRDLVAGQNHLPSVLDPQVEQNMYIPGYLQGDGLPAPGSVRPIHRADVHIVEPDGEELSLHVGVPAVAPDSDCDSGREILREEHVKSLKCMAYRQEGVRRQCLGAWYGVDRVGAVWASGPRGPIVLSSTALTFLSDKV